MLSVCGTLVFESGDPTECGLDVESDKRHRIPRGKSAPAREGFGTTDVSAITHGTEMRPAAPPHRELAGPRNGSALRAPVEHCIWKLNWVDDGQATASVSRRVLCRQR